LSGQSQKSHVTVQAFKAQLYAQRLYHTPTPEEQTNMREGSAWRIDPRCEWRFPHTTGSSKTRWR